MKSYTGNDNDQYLHDQIVHQLRSQGWCREDALERADVLIAMMHGRKEKENNND